MDDAPIYDPEGDGPEAQMALAQARQDAAIDQLIRETRWPFQVPRVDLSLKLWLMLYGPGRRPRRW